MFFWLFVWGFLVVWFWPLFFISFNSVIPGAARMLCFFKVLEMVPSCPDFGVTGSLNIRPFVNYALVYLPFILTVSFQGFTILLS